MSQLYYVYECVANGVRGSDGEADHVWFSSPEGAFEAVGDGLDDVSEDDGEWAWSGRIRRLEATWDAIVEVWGENVPNESKFEQVKRKDG